VLEIRKLLILKSTESLKSPEATFLGTIQAQRPADRWIHMLMRCQSAGRGKPLYGLQTVYWNMTSRRFYVQVDWICKHLPTSGPILRMRSIWHNFRMLRQLVISR